MPLSKARNRDRMRVSRATCVQPNPVQPTLGELRELIKGIEAKPVVQPSIPLYNPAIHKPGDSVLVQQGKRLVETVIPELDGDGNPIYT